MPDEQKSKNNWSQEKLEGVLTGLLIASFICEERSGALQSYNAMAIMRYRTNVELAAGTGKNIPHWGGQK